MAHRSWIRRVQQHDKNLGVLRVANLIDSCDAGYRRAYRIMKDNGLATPSRAKPKEEKMGAV